MNLALVLLALLIQASGLTCDAACVDNYDAATSGLLGIMAEVNGIDRAQFVRGAVAFNYQWGLMAERVLQRPLTIDDWNAAYYDNFNAYADYLGIPSPYEMGAASATGTRQVEVCESFMWQHPTPPTWHPIICRTATIPGTRAERDPVPRLRSDYEAQE